MLHMIDVSGNNNNVTSKTQPSFFNLPVEESKRYGFLSKAFTEIRPVNNLIIVEGLCATLRS